MPHASFDSTMPETTRMIAVISCMLISIQRPETWTLSGAKVSEGKNLIGFVRNEEENNKKCGQNGRGSM
jgi:hypothetical protein